jgi:enterochelin esterase-like enzyme
LALPVRMKPLSSPRSRVGLQVLTTAALLLQLFAAAAQTVGETPGFYSAALDRQVDYRVTLPRRYEEEPTRRYPVVYLLHGRGDTMHAWEDGALELHRLAEAGRIPSVIAVMPDAPASGRASYYINSRFSGNEELPAGQAMETAIAVDLVAHVDKAYRTLRSRNSRVVAGYSMGGYGALRLVLAHPDKFGAAVVLSPAVYVPLPPSASSAREFGAFGWKTETFSDRVYESLNYPALLPDFARRGVVLPVFIAVGDDEIALSDPAEARHDLDYEAHTLYNQLRRIPGVVAQLRVIDGGHDWRVWHPMFIEGVEYVFRQLCESEVSASSAP